MQIDQQNFIVYKNEMVNGESCEVVIESFGPSHKAYTAIYKKNFKHSLGGVRFVTTGSMQEAAHLAKGMAEKIALNSIPVNGQKCLIICENEIPSSAMERAAIISYHLNIVKKIEPDIIFGPDMGSPEEVMDLAASNFNLLGNVTGLSRKEGGLEIDKNGYTAIGAYEALCVAKEFNPSLSTISIQGFGAVGTTFLQLLNRKLFTVKALSNIKGVLIFESEKWNTEDLLEMFNRYGDDCLQKFAERSQAGIFSENKDFIFEIPVDIFIPAARTTILALDTELSNAKKENPDVKDVSKFKQLAKPKLILEIANHPLTYLAEDFLESNDVLVLPDFVVNCGGMIGCYHEFANRTTLRNEPGEYNNLNKYCQDYIKNEMNRNIRQLIQTRGPKRLAANSVMKKNLAETLSKFKSSQS